MFSGGPNGGGGNAPQAQDVLTDLKAWWSRTGLFTKSVTYSTLAVYVLGFITDELYFLLKNTAALTFLHLQLWRLFTAAFVHKSIFELIFVYLSLLPSMATQERQWGTLKTVIDFFVKNFEIFMACNILTLFLSFIIKGFANWETYGLWSFFLVYLTQRCLQDPTGTSQLCCLPFQIPNKWFPLVLILLFSLLGSPKFDMLMGYLVAYVHYNYLDVQYHGFLNTTRLTGWENSVFCSCLRASSIYVSVSDAGNLPSQAASAQQERNQPHEEAGSAHHQQEEPQPMKAFSGKGVVIGGMDPNNREPEAGRSQKNYNQLGEQDDTDGDIESNSTDNQSKL